MAKTTFVITGGAGFVGSSLAISFKKSSPAAQVIAVDNLKRRGSELNLPRLQKAGVEFIHGDIRNPEDLAAINACDFLIECAAEPSVHAGYDGSPAYVVNTNLVGSLNCLELARKFKANVIFLSTSRVYPMKALSEIPYETQENRLAWQNGSVLSGFSAQYGVAENFPLDGSRSMYGFTKLSSELLLTEYMSMYGLKGIINRCGVLTGPWQMGQVDQGVIALWVARHYFGRKLSYIGYGGSGKQVRDILHVDDLFDLLKIQIQNFDEHSGQLYNVGGGLANSVSLKELTAFCQEVTGRTVEIASVPETRAADIPCFITDCRKVMQATGWQPQRSVKKIVEDIFLWIQKNEELLQPIFAPDKSGESSKEWS